MLSFSLGITIKWRSIRSFTVLFKSCIFMVNMNLNKTILQSNTWYYISLIPFICNRKLAKRLKLQFCHNFKKEIFRFAEQRNVKITDLLVLVFYADRIAMLFRISVAMSFLSASFLASFLHHHKLTRSQPRMLNSIVMAQSFGAKQMTLRKIVFTSATASSDSRLPCSEICLS